jgi:hypothetical protein
MRQETANSMRTVSRIALLAMIAVLALAAAPALAQSDTTTRTVRLTEAEANAFYRVTNPILRSMSDVSVDFQPDQVVISATVTLRRQTPVAVSGTFVPEVRNGRIYWTATVATIDGEQVSDSLLRQINQFISAAWRNYIRSTMGVGRVTDVTITDTELTITLTRTR